LLEKKKWWAVAAGKREGEISRGCMENDGRPSDTSDVGLEAFPNKIMKCRDEFHAYS
jgi:hypothetical protein